MATSLHKFFVLLAVVLATEFVSAARDFESMISDYESETALLARNSRSSCTFQCKDGSSGKPRPGYKPKPNGCGTTGFMFKLMPRLRKCCDQHDICYGTCGTSRKICDDQMYQCAKQQCSSFQKRITISLPNFCKEKWIDFAIRLFGCSAFLKSQKEACVCWSSILFGGPEVETCRLNAPQLITNNLFIEYIVW